MQKNIAKVFLCFLFFFATDLLCVARFAIFHKPNFEAKTKYNIKIAF